jgi:hypothetical protein
MNATTRAGRTRGTAGTGAARRLAAIAVGLIVFTGVGYSVEHQAQGGPAVHALTAQADGDGGPESGEGPNT